jgi:hypothetical protein
MLNYKPGLHNKIMIILLWKGCFVYGLLIVYIYIYIIYLSCVVYFIIIIIIIYNPKYTHK